MSTLRIKGDLDAAVRRAARRNAATRRAAAEPGNNMRAVKVTRGERVTNGRGRQVVKMTYPKSAAWRPSDARALESVR